VQRVSVVGTSGSGKSTLARELARRLGASWLELDSVYHQAGWTPLDAAEFRARVADAAAGERWVIDDARAGQHIQRAFRAFCGLCPVGSCG
jgi:adenylate kinase family enzyme